MTCEQYGEWLGDAVEGTLDADRQAQLDAHCRDCAACRALLTDLQQIRAAAATLDRRTPSPELWRAIVAKVEDQGFAAPAQRRRTWASAWSQLAAAAALVLMLGAAAWFAGGNQFRRVSDSSESDLVRNAASELQLAEQHYENAIAALEQLTVNRDNALDPAVAAEIAQSLQSIDRAINDSRAALKSDPNSFVAQTSLLEALRMKVGLLQETVSLMNARS
jgi:tetratricopeptide (TPR) repeat protein